MSAEELLEELELDVDVDVADSRLEAIERERNKAREFHELADFYRMKARQHAARWSDRLEELEREATGGRD